MIWPHAPFCFQPMRAGARDPLSEWQGHGKLELVEEASSLRGMADQSILAASVADPRVGHLGKSGLLVHRDQRVPGSSFQPRSSCEQIHWGGVCQAWAQPASSVGAWQREESRCSSRCSRATAVRPQCPQGSQSPSVDEPNPERRQYHYCTCTGRPDSCLQTHRTCRRQSRCLGFACMSARIRLGRYTTGRMSWRHHIPS